MRAHRPSLAHAIDETLQDGEAVVPDFRVAEVDVDDGQQLRWRRRAAGCEEALVASAKPGSRGRATIPAASRNAKV